MDLTPEQWREPEAVALPPIPRAPLLRLADTHPLRPALTFQFKVESALTPKSG